jgi:hypothetical protein
MSISCGDITPADRDAIMSAYGSIRLEAPNGISYGILSDKQYSWLVPVAENVQRLLWYDKNWDSHGALPVSYIAMQESFSVLSHVMSDENPVPRLSLTASGGIQIEWRAKTTLLQVEVDSDGSLSAYFSNTSPGAESEWEADSLQQLSLVREKLRALTDSA